MQVTINNPCKADGEYLMPGDTPELSDADAQALIDSGAAELYKQTASTKPDDADVLHAAIRDAVESLDKDNADLFTKGGKAKTEALEAVLGYAITAAERDASMADA